MRGKGSAIEWARPQWVEGDNEALHYRGRELKRGKMWFQSGDPRTEGFVKYYYTGWQRAVLPATSDVAHAPELVPALGGCAARADCADLEERLLPREARVAMPDPLEHRPWVGGRGAHFQSVPERVVLPRALAR